MGWLLRDGVLEPANRSDSTFSLRLTAILVNSVNRLGEIPLTFSKIVFKKLFSKKSAPLTGIPAVRRLKTYSAQSGYVYQYFYEGHRKDEYVFTVSASGKEWHTTTVMVSDAAVQPWEQANARKLSATERYAIAKMALFQAFDDRPSPASMKDDVQVRAADVDAIVATLEL